MFDHAQLFSFVPVPLCLAETATADREANFAEGVAAMCVVINPTSGAARRAVSSNVERVVGLHTCDARKYPRNQLAIELMEELANVRTCVLSRRSCPTSEICAEVAWTNLRGAPLR